MRCTTLLRAASGFVTTKDYEKTRVITLSREKGLNSLSLEMLDDLREAIVINPHSDAQAVTIVKSSTPKALSTGGDVIQQTSGDISKTLGKWSCVQGLTDYQILISTAPFVSFLNGYLMGGAAGLGLNERYRVATETTQFAMPECTIGFFPNGGTTWILPRVPIKGLGLYLALTGARLKGADNVHAGLATHYVPSKSLGELEKALVELKDPFQLPRVISSFETELPPLQLEKDLAVLESVFTVREDTTIEGIMEKLREYEEKSALAKSALATLKVCSPLSLKVTLEQHRLSPKYSDYFEALEREIFTAQRITEEPDFKEGVRALLLDKTKDPKWSRSLAEVTPSLVNEMMGTSKKGYYHIHKPNDGVINNVKSLEYSIL